MAATYMLVALVNFAVAAPPVMLKQPSESLMRKGRYFIAPLAINQPPLLHPHLPTLVRESIQQRNAGTINKQVGYSPETLVLIPENNQDLMTLQQLSQPGSGYVMPVASAPWSHTHTWPVAQGSSQARRTFPFLGNPEELPFQGRDGSAYDSVVNAIRQFVPIITIDPAINGVSFLTPTASEVLVAATAKADVRDGADVVGLAATNVNGEAFFHQENGLKDINTLVTVAGLPPSRTFNLGIFDGADLNTAGCGGTGALYTPKGLTGVIASNVQSSGAGALAVVQRTPASVMNVGGISGIVGKSFVVFDAATGSRVACGLITVL